MTQSIVLFALAGLCEIGGGYLVWIWLREGRSHWIGLLGRKVGALPSFVLFHDSRVAQTSCQCLDGCATLQERFSRQKFFNHERIG